MPFRCIAGGNRASRREGWAREARRESLGTSGFCKVHERNGMLLAADAHYYGNRTVAAAALFEDWNSELAESEICESCGLAEPYIPGSLYRRELPCLSRLLHCVENQIDTIVIDGYVWLTPGAKPGLRARLFQLLDERIPVIGVAKNPFKGATHARKVLRGRSRCPLYVTAVGTNLERAAMNVARMHGPFRIPTLIRRADELSRKPQARI